MVNKAEVGRFDGELKTIAFNEGDKISSLLEKAGLTLGTGEGLNNDSAEDVNPTDTAVDGETYLIIGNYKQGSEAETEKPKEESEDKEEEKVEATEETTEKAE